MKCYKLTDQNGQTKNKMQWGENITHTASGTGQNLCSDEWIHFYTNPLIAILLNPMHANFVNPILWEAESFGKELHEPLKSGAKTLTTIRQISVPSITITQKVAFGILCALEVHYDTAFIKWANAWLNNTNRLNIRVINCYCYY